MSDLAPSVLLFSIAGGYAFLQLWPQTRHRWDALEWERNFFEATIAGSILFLVTRTIVFFLERSHVFCQARDYLLSEGVILSTMGPSSHKQVWGEFKYRGRTHRSIWLNGDKLHYNRIQADYVNEIKLLDLTVNESFEMAERIVYYLNQIIKLN